MKRNINDLLFTALTVILLVSPPKSFAEKYVEVSREKLNNVVTLFDIDSPKLNLATKGVEFKYRMVSDSFVGSGRTALEYTAVAWCSQMTMWDLRADWVDGGRKFSVRENYKEGQGWTDTPAIFVTNFSQRDGKLLVAACDAGHPTAMDQLMQPPPASDCLNPKDAFTKTWCTTSSEMRGDMMLLDRRIDSIGQKCGNKTQLLKILGSKADSLKHCYGGDKCVWGQLSELILAINEDVRELEKWESSGSPQPFPTGKICNVETKIRKADHEKQARNARHELVSKTTAIFLACVKRSIAQLDDRKSDAAVIAKVVYRPCSKELYDTEEAHKERDGKLDSEQLKKHFEGELLEMILTNRSVSK